MANGAKVATCCCCGQVLPPKIPIRGVVKQRIYETIKRRPGLLAMQLMDVIYADDPNGGPESVNILHVHIKQLNDQLRPHGLHIRGRYSQGYYLMPL